MDALPDDLPDRSSIENSSFAAGARHIKFAFQPSDFARSMHGISIARWVELAPLLTKSSSGCSRLETS
jgi:hypothetical protein